MKPLFAMRSVKNIHFVGIGGVGMAGIAEVLLSEGYAISGSDVMENALTKRLVDKGAIVFYGHDADHVQKADVIVQSSAIANDNIEIITAKKAHIPIVKRAEMLGELMRFRYGIAIAGTHGKTTTTSLVTSLFVEAGLDPTFVIGGRLNSAGSNAHLGRGDYLIAEADESDASFLYLKPMISVITNIDADHMETYHHQFSELRQAFIDFLHRLPFYGLAVLCQEDPVIRELLPHVARPFVTYGLSPDAHFYATDISQQGTRVHFRVKRPQQSDLPITLNLPGQHNILNALAAIAIGTELHIPDDVMQRAFLQFQGIGRRFHIYGDYPLQNGGQVTLVDDYGHHPREIEVTLRAARASWPDRRIVMVYQPHRYTRTRDLFQDFCRILSTVDELILLEVYSAGEAYIAGADSATLLQQIATIAEIPTTLVKEHHQLKSLLQTILHDGDVLFMQGAGNVGALAAQLAATGLITQNAKQSESTK